MGDPVSRAGAGDHPGDAAAEGQDQGFDQELALDVAAVRAERPADTDLAAPLGHRDQHDVHHPDAADDQADAADGGQQQGHQPELRFHLLDELFGADDLELKPPGALGEVGLHVARGIGVVHARRRAGDDQLDLRLGLGAAHGGDGHEDRAVRIHRERQRIGLRRGLERAEYRVEAPAHLQDLAHHGTGAAPAHGVCHIRADHREVAAPVEVRDEPPLGHH